jgi:hypothetical protein
LWFPSTASFQGRIDRSANTENNSLRELRYINPCFTVGEQ